MTRFVPYVAAFAAVAVIGVCYLAFPREVERKVVISLPVRPTYAQIEKAVENIAPLDTAEQVINQRWYRCGYYDNSGSPDDTAPFEASLLWCIHAPDLELPPPGTG